MNLPIAVKMNNFIEVIGYGPKSIAMGSKFNEQLGGLSALWIQFSGSIQTNDVNVFVDGLRLKTDISEGVITAYLPKDILEIPKIHLINIHAAGKAMLAQPLPFEVIGTWDSVSETAELSCNEFLKKETHDPNFFIIGGARCGTTSMYWELLHHPEVYMSGIKEPFFFDPVFREAIEGAVKTKDAYDDLFRQCHYGAKIIGEASTSYLGSRKALQSIKDNYPAAKLLVMLRNPADAAYSLNQRMCDSGVYESERNFERAWELQIPRRSGLFLPESPIRRWEVLQYQDRFMFGEQIEFLLKLFPRGNLHFILFDELVSEPDNAYKKLLDFLGAESEGMAFNTITNESSAKDKIHLNEKFVTHLKCVFKSDIEKLGSLINKDLSKWIS